MSLSFTWPAILLGLLFLPLATALYLRIVRRRAAHPVTFAPFPTVRQSVLHGRTYRRHLPAALLLLALAALIIAAARPVFPLPIPADRSALMLAIDVSGSMRSTDVEPSRMEAAKTAAKAFVEALPDRIRVGLVAFAGFASLIAPPGTEHRQVIDAIDGLGMARRTAIGEGLLEAVAALPGRARPGPDGSLPPPQGDPQPPGIVVLLSDGRTNTGIHPLDASELARRQDVTVYTIGLGKPVTPSTGWTIGGPLDEETLQAIATITGGTYYHASSARGLQQIYTRLARTVGWERRPTEVTALVAGAGAALLIAALSLSWLWAQPAGL